MENKTEYQAQLFANRLKKKYKEVRKWARKNRISCYRLYDRDIPEVPVSFDLYEFLPSDCTTPIEAARFLSEQNAKLSANDPLTEREQKERTYGVLYLYDRTYEKDDNEEEEWLSAIAKAASEVIGIPIAQIIKKMRKHQKGLQQYEKNKNDDYALTGLSVEQGQVFNLNLTSYLDTGLFFDHRPLRATIRDSVAKKSVLNLFCYTGSFSVYAAEGNAKKVESVDLSNTYLAWAKDNMKQNGFVDKNKYIFTRADCIRFLEEKLNSTEELEKYDVIILDPPTFSNSKNTENVLDINRKWPELVTNCLNLLNPGGTLFFSTNSERLKMDRALIPQANNDGCTIGMSDITTQTIPRDFEGTKCHRCWKFDLGKK